MTTADATAGATTAENTARQDGGGVHAEPVPTPAGGVRGADQVPAPAGGVRGADQVDRTPPAAYAAPTRSQPPPAAYAAPTRWTGPRRRRTRRRPGGPDPAGGVRGADQVDRMAPAAYAAPTGEGTTTGADGQTPAREQMRVAQGERSASAGREDDDALEQAAALGETSDPADGSVAGG